MFCSLGFLSFFSGLHKCGRDCWCKINAINTFALIVKMTYHTFIAVQVEVHVVFENLDKFIPLNLLNLFMTCEGKRTIFTEHGSFPQLSALGAKVYPGSFDRTRTV